MSRGFKPDAFEIQEYIDHLQKQPWMYKSRAWWPRFVFHFTNMDNAIRILESGKLLSRNRIEQTGGMPTDNASAEVIDQTDDRWKDYVRLYFRPRTPTQHNNEGFRPEAYRERNSHCPVPVYFLFDAKKLLSREGVFFSKISLAVRHARIFSDAAGFRSIPFERVYHDTRFEPHERSEIIQHRHAEVVVQDELDLEDLKHVWCRSEAEYQTFLNRLSPETRERWKERIGGGKKGNLFFREWIFVDKVDLSKDSITFTLNVPPLQELHIPMKLLIEDLNTGKKNKWEKPQCKVQDRLRFHISVQQPSYYSVKLYFENQLMYYGRFSEELEVPY